MKICLIFLTCFLVGSLTPVAAYEYAEVNSTNISGHSNYQDLNLNNSTINGNDIYQNINSSNIETNNSNITGSWNKTEIADELIHPDTSMFQKIDFTTMLLYQWYGIHTTVNTVENGNDMHNILRTTIKNCKNNNIPVSASKIFVIGTKNGKISFYQLIDGNTDYGIYVFQSQGKKVITESLGDLGFNYIYLTVNSKDANITETGDILEYIANNYDNISKDVEAVKSNNTTKNSTEIVNKDNQAAIYKFSEWVCINLAQFLRMSPAFISWDDLKTGMTPICIMNPNDYTTIETLLITAKTDNDITLLSSTDGKQYLINKTTFMEDLYTGISLKPVDNTTITYNNWTATPEISSLTNFSSSAQKTILSYTNYLFKEIFSFKNPTGNLVNETALKESLSPKNNAFINAAWTISDIYKSYGLETQIKRLTLNEVRSEYTKHQGILLLLKDETNHFYYAPIVRVYANSFDLQIGNEVKNVRDWDLLFTGMVLIVDNNDDISTISLVANNNLQNIDPIKMNKKDPSTAEIVRQFASDHISELTLYGIIGIPLIASALSSAAAYFAGGTIATAIGSYITIVSGGIITVSAVPGGVVVVAVAAGAALVAAALGSICYGIYKLVDKIKKNRAFDKLKDKYHAKEL